MIAAAASVTVLDGFDALSLSLMMPAMSQELRITPGAVGAIFAGTIAGMIVGAVAGGALADRLGRLRTLIAAVLLLSASCLTMPLLGSAPALVANRVIAGLGLGTAAPVAVALLNADRDRRPTELVVSLVWAGIGAGGMLAAVCAYLLASSDWRLMFIIGGIAPLPACLLAYRAFRGVDEPARDLGSIERGRWSHLFRRGQARRTAIVAAMFFFGFVSTANIVAWLPTVLRHQGASPILVSVSFASVNAGALFATALLGLLAARYGPGLARTAAWSAAAACGLAIIFSTPSTTTIALLATAGAIAGAAAQALSVALANEMYAAQGLQSSTLGFMTGSGRFGQFCGLASSGAIVSWSGQETIVFGVTGVTAGAAALFSLLAAANRPASTPLWRRVR